MPGIYPPQRPLFVSWHPDRPPCTLLLIVMVLLGCAALPRGARAQTPSPLAEWQYSAGVPLRELFTPTAPRWQIELGAATSVAPLYDGAQRYRVMGGPTIDIRYRDRYFASTGEGIGANLLRGRNWRVGIALTYDLGRRAADYASHLHGLGNISPASVAKLFGEYVISKQFPLVLRADIRRDLGGADGWIGDVGAYMPMPGSSRDFFWFAGPTATFADANDMNGWFGITRAQSVLSGYAPYKADAGLRSFGFGVSGVWFFRKHWFLNADVAVEQLVGSAARSPITESATNGVLDLTIAYQF